MSTIENSAREVQEMIDRFLGPSRHLVENADRLVAQLAAVEAMARPALKFWEDMEQTLQVVERRHKKFAAMVRKLRWPPPGHLSSRGLDKLADAYEKGEITEERVVNLIIEAYTPDVLGLIESGWAAQPWLGDRLAVFQEAMANYRDKRYHSAIYTVMPHFEGLLGTALGRKPKPEADAPTVFSGTGDLASEYYLTVILESFNGWDMARQPPELSRHALLHGRTTSPSPREHALKLLIVLDYLIKGIADYLATKNADD